MKSNNKSLDFLFEQAKKQDAKSSFEKTKGMFETNVASGKPAQSLREASSIFKLKTLLIMIGIITLIATLSIVIYNTNELETERQVLKTTENSVRPDKNEKSGSILSPEKNQTEAIVTSITLKNDSAFDRTTTYETLENGALIRKEVLDYREDYSFSVETISERPDEVEPYRFPILTEEEIKENQRNKSKILKRLAKLDRKYYAFIPSGSYQVEGQKCSVNAFYIRNTEITLLEYRTFLFDLLIMNRKADFLIAKPDQDLWLTLGAYNEPMKNLYFSHPAYDEYPVNNISRAGAEMYCKWLSEEVIKLGEGKMKRKISQARIPTDLEWMWAAYGGNNEAYLYPWKTNDVLREEECYLANFKPVAPDSTGKPADFYFLDGGFFTVKVDSYFPNDFGLYNMSGNLSEMVVLSRENNLPGTKGGSWMDDKDELIITASDLHKGETDPHLGIGFRPVFSFLMYEGTATRLE